MVTAPSPPSPIERAMSQYRSRVQQSSTQLEYRHDMFPDDVKNRSLPVRTGYLDESLNLDSKDVRFNVLGIDSLL